MRTSATQQANAHHRHWMTGKTVGRAHQMLRTRSQNSIVTVGEARGCGNANGGGSAMGGEETSAHVPCYVRDVWPTRLVLSPHGQVDRAQ